MTTNPNTGNSLQRNLETLFQKMNKMETSNRDLEVRQIQQQLRSKSNRSYLAKDKEKFP